MKEGDNMKRFQETRLYEFLEDRYYDIRDFLDDFRDRFSRKDYDDDDEYFSVFDEKKPWYKEKKPMIAMISSVIIAIPLVFYVKDTIAKRNAESEIKPLAANESAPTKTLTLGNGSDEATSLTMADLHQALQTGDSRSKYNAFLAKNSDVTISAKRQLPEIESDTVIAKLSDGVVLILFKNDAIIQMQDFKTDVEAKDYITALINANATTNDDGTTTTANGVTLPDEDDDESSSDNGDSSSSALDTFADEDDTDSSSGNITTNVDEDAQNRIDDNLLAASQEREKNAYDEKNEYKVQLEKEKEARKKAEKAKKKAEDEAKQAKSDAEKAELAQLRKEAEAAQAAANKAKEDAQKASLKAEQAEKALTVSNFKDRVHVGMSASSYQNVISKYNWSKASTIALYDGAYMHVFKTNGGSYMTVGVNSSNTKVTTVKQVASLDKAKTLAKSIKYQSAYSANEAIKKSAESKSPNHEEALMESAISKHLKVGTKLKSVKSYLKKDRVEHVATFDVGTKGDMYVITASEGFVTVLIRDGVVTATKHVKNLDAAVKLANEQYKD